MELLIDTTEKGLLKLAFLDSDKEFKKNVKTERLSEQLLPSLDKFLKSKKKKLSDIDQVLVNPGPGSFSAVRAGVSVANALAFALGLDQDQVNPLYDREPNITVSKSKIKNTNLK